jgi:DNA-binding winged helix-turn-helix (wHTH) protein/tetratricopeptide (TPR) repeat protein
MAFPSANASLAIAAHDVKDSMINDGGHSALASRSGHNQLAKRADFHLGNVLVRPSVRTVEGPEGVHKGEPRVLQVLVALADAQGKVLSREDLLEQCWDGRIVGDDAVNRAVAEVRRITATAGADFELETVPRVGYRLTGIDWLAGPDDTERPDPPSGINRRQMIVGGTVLLGLFAGGSAAIVYRQRNVEIDRLIEQGRTLQASGRRGGEREAEALFRKALDRNSDRADAWGWLAVVSKDADKAREAAERALQLDSREPNARTVLAFQRRDLDDWTRWEDELLAVIRDAPSNAAALSHLTLFYQGMGRCRDSLSNNERAIQVEPFNPSHHARRALKHWIFGNVAEADKVAVQALRLWPGNATVWNANMVICAFTGRASAGLVLLDNRANQPVDLSSASADAWRSTLLAIGSRAPGDIAKAIKINTAAAPLSPGLAANAIMAFSYLGEVDACYSVADGLLTNRGPLVQGARGKALTDLYSGPTWGRTQFLFIPACRTLRADERFADLCQRMGHVDYWRHRGVWPDAFVRGSLDPAKLTGSA